MSDPDRVGYLTTDQFIQDISPGVGTNLSGTFQPLNTTLTALSSRNIGAATATDILDRASGDGRYLLTSTSLVSSFNTRTGAVTLTSADVTTALTYTPTSVTGLTGTQTVAAFKTGLSLVKADVGLSSVDDTADVAKNVLSATKLTTARTIDGQSFDGTANITVLAPGTHAATSKTTPVDADELPLVDSAATNTLKKLTWANVKATLKTYFDTLYLGISATAAAATKLATARTIAGNSFDGTGNITIKDTDLTGAARTSYTPTVTSSTGTIGSYTVSADYRKVGNRVTYTAIVTITAVGSGSGYIRVTLPINAARNAIGRSYEDVNTGSFGGSVILTTLSSSFVSSRFLDATTQIALNNRVTIEIDYET